MDILKDLKSRIEVAADEVGGTDIEKKVKKATSLENWPATNTQLHELSQATNDYACYKEIMPLLWKRLGEPPRNWRTIYKCLVLLEHLIRFGSPRVVEEARDRNFVLRQLQDFYFREDGDKDRGSGIREKSKLICDLLADPKQLEVVRKEAAQNLHKFVGVSNNGSVSSIGGGSRYGGGGASYDERGFGGGNGAFGSGGGEAYDSYDKKDKSGSEEKKHKKSKSDKDESAGDSPYGETHEKDSPKKKKHKKHTKDEDAPEEASNDPYEDASGEAPKKKKKKADKDDEDAEDKEKAEKKAAKKALKLKMRETPITGQSAAPVLAPPAADDGFGDFTTAAPATAAASNSSGTLSFDSIGSSNNNGAAARSNPSTTSGGDLIDIFAATTLNAPTTTSNPNWAAQAHGPVDFLSGSSATPQPAAKIATPNLFDAPSKEKPKSSPPPQTAHNAQIQVNAHNNADAFSSFVAGQKIPQQTPAATSATASNAPKKSGELAWDNGLINLDGMASNKTAPKNAPAPFLGSSLDPFSHIHGQQQQQQRQMMQQRPGGMVQPGFGGPQMGGMGMSGGMGGMGMQPQMGMGMGMGQTGMAPMGMQPGMGMGGMGMGMGMGMQPGFGGMPQGGGMQGLGFPSNKPAGHDVFF